MQKSKMQIYVKKGNSKWTNNSIEIYLAGNVLKCCVLGNGTMIDFCAKKRSLAQKFLVLLIVLFSFLLLPLWRRSPVHFQDHTASLLRLDQTISWLCLEFLSGYLPPQAKMEVKKAVTPGLKPQRAGKEPWGPVEQECGHHHQDWKKS